MGLWSVISESINDTYAEIDEFVLVLMLVITWSVHVFDSGSYVYV